MELQSPGGLGSSLDPTAHEAISSLQNKDHCNLSEGSWWIKWWFVNNMEETGQKPGWSCSERLWTDLWVTQPVHTGRPPTVGWGWGAWGIPLEQSHWTFCSSRPTVRTSCVSLRTQAKHSLVVSNLARFNSWFLLEGMGFSQATNPSQSFRLAFCKPRIKLDLSLWATVENYMKWFVCPCQCPINIRYSYFCIIIILIVYALSWSCFSRCCVGKQVLPFIPLWCLQIVSRRSGSG